MKKIIIVNLIIFLFLFVFMEIFSYCAIGKQAESYTKPYNENARKSGYDELIHPYAPIVPFNQDEYDGFRPVAVGSAQKPSLLFFGCSYTAGATMEDNETLPYLVSKLTNRTAINRGINSGCIYNALHDLNNEKFYEEISKYPKPDYIFYLWINDHANRIYDPYVTTFITKSNLKYYTRVMFKEKKGKIVEEKYGFFKRLILFFYTTKAYYSFFLTLNQKKENPTEKMAKYVLETKRITDEKFPDSKFVIIEYKDGSHLLMQDELKKILSENGIIILDAEKLAGHELESEIWRAEDKEHPSGAAYKDVAKGLVKELNL